MRLFIFVSNPVSFVQFLAPEVGFEPTTKWLHVILKFPLGVDYLFTVTFVLGVGCIVSEPSPTSRGSAADYHTFVKASRNSPYVHFGVSTEGCNTLQPPALPLSYSGIISFRYKDILTG
jgi:hypothetical protein